MSNISIERLEDLAKGKYFLAEGAYAEAQEMARELLEYRKASKDAVAWTDAEELRDAEKDGCGYLFKVNPITPHADPLRVIKLFAAPQLQQFNVPDEQTWEELCMQNPELTIGDAIIRAAAWNACREAMINMMRKVS